MEVEKKKRGRKRKYTTEEQRQKAINASKRNYYYRQTYGNVGEEELKNKLYERYVNRRYKHIC